MNGKIRVLAYAYIAICGFFIVVGLFVLAGLALSRDPTAERAFIFIGVPFSLLSIVYFIPGLLGGIGLLRGRAWARTVITVLSVLVMFFIPIGTAFGGWGLWVLKRAPREPGLPATQPARPPLGTFTAEQTSRWRGILLAMLGVACAFVVAIGTGYRVTHDPSSPIPDDWYYAAIVGLAVLLALGLRAAVRAPRSYWGLAESPGFGGERIFATPREAAQILAKRVAELNADPIKRKYVARVEAGEYWPDEQIEYAEDPTRLASCPHLQPIEGAMRAAGIGMRLTSLPTVRASCRVDPVALGERFALPEFVRYAEMHIPDRSLEDPPIAFIECDECRWSIDVVHPSQASPTTPWFPV